MDSAQRDEIDAEIESGLLPTIRKLKAIVNSSEEETQHVISAGRTLIQYSELSIKKKEVKQDQNTEMQRLQMEHLQNALIGLAVIANMKVQAGDPPPQMVMAQIEEKTHEELPTLSVDVKPEYTQDKSYEPLPAYVQGIQVPSRIRHERKMNA